MPLITVGHGTLSQQEFTELLEQAEVESLVDIRSFPASRAHPHMARERMEHWLPEAGIDYRWEQRLGGRRRLPKGAPDEDPWWRVEAFRAYAAWTRTEDWRAAFEPLVEEARDRRTAVCCSESLWWRCHRRLVADVATLTSDLEVLDLMHDGSLQPHPVAEGARLRDDAVYWTG